MRRFGKISNETKVFLVFFFFLLVFTLARGPIGAINATLLTFTGEMPPPSNNEKDGCASRTNGRTAANRLTARKKKIPDKPTTTNLPKTKTPVVAWCDTLSVSVAHAPKFPPLRKYDGTRWSKEGTDIQAVTDGNKIRFKFHLRDSDPADAVTEHSRKNPDLAWMDDGIELFLMKNPKADIYCQYAVSVIGRGSTYFMKCNEGNLASGSRSKTPPDFIPPLMIARRTSDGFEIELTVDLSNIGADALKPGDSFLIQVVRNYRGQRDERSATLQLFPTHIYADNRHGAINHHRKAFQPVRIVDSKELKSKTAND